MKPLDVVAERLWLVGCWGAMGGGGWRRGSEGRGAEEGGIGDEQSRALSLFPAAVAVVEWGVAHWTSLTDCQTCNHSPNHISSYTT